MSSREDQGQGGKGDEKRRTLDVWAVELPATPKPQALLTSSLPLSVVLSE